MSFKFRLSIVAIVLGASLATATPINVLGIETGTPSQYSVVPSLTDVSFTKVSIADFATINLNSYDVLFISDCFVNGSVTVPSQNTLNALNARESDISSWLYAGHGIVALSEPIGTGRYEWLPDAIQPTSVITQHVDGIHITAPDHPVMDGLTDAGLSNWGCSSHAGIIAPSGMDILAVNSYNNPVTLAGQYGTGKVVITSQDADWHNYYGRNAQQVAFVQNAINWVAPTASVPEPAPLFLMLSGLIALAGIRYKTMGK